MTATGLLQAWMETFDYLILALNNSTLAKYVLGTNIENKTSQLAVPILTLNHICSFCETISLKAH